MLNRYRTPSELIKEGDNLFTLPDIYIRVRQLVNDPDSSLVDIANVIAHDPSLTARLLKIVNSPAFGFASKVDTVSRAVSIMGMQQVHDIVLATSVTNSFSSIFSPHMDIDVFWRKSIFCGVVSHLLAIECNTLEAERLFVAGLLRDIGHLLMYSKLPELSHQALMRTEDRKSDLPQAEKELIGYSYAEVGGQLMSDWTLPAPLIDAVGFHINPGLSRQFSFEASIVHMASALADASDADLPPDNFSPSIMPIAWEATGLTPEVIGPINEKASERVTEVVELLLPNRA